MSAGVRAIWNASSAVSPRCGGIAQPVAGTTRENQLPSNMVASAKTTVSADGGPGPTGGPLRPPGPPIVRCLVTEQAKTLRTSEMEAFCKPSRKKALRRAYLQNFLARPARSQLAVRMALETRRRPEYVNYRRAGVAEDVIQHIGGWKTRSMFLHVVSRAPEERSLTRLRRRAEERAPRRDGAHGAIAGDGRPTSLTEGQQAVDAPGRWLRGAKGKLPVLTHLPVRLSA